MHWQAYRCKVFWAIVIGQNVLFALIAMFIIKLFSDVPVVEALLLDPYAPSIFLLALFNASSLPMSILLAKRVEVYTDTVSKGELLDQIRHDTRNSLFALFNIAKKNASALDDDFQKILSCINRIESTLADTQKIKKLWKAKNDVTFIDYLIENAVSDANFISQKIAPKKNISIVFDRARSKYGSFTLVKEETLSRVLEIVLNNAIESIGETEKDHGIISIRVKEQDDQYRVIVKDSGKGAEKSIIPKVFNKYFSSGKKKTDKSGMGLGLSWAKESLLEEGANIEFHSISGRGATVSIILPKGKGPHLLCDSLAINSDSKIVIVDECENILSKWESRLSRPGLTPRFVQTLDQFHDLIKNNAIDGNYIFLVDYNFLNDSSMGHALAKEVQGVSQEARVVFVTDKIHNAKIYDDCKKLGVSILPKPMIDTVPLILDAKMKSTDDVRAILLEDDELICEYIHIHFSTLGMSEKLSVFRSWNELSKKLKEIPKDVAFFLDNRLGDKEKKGHLLAQELIGQGFENVSLITGDANLDLSDVNTDGVKEIIEKNSSNLIYDRIEAALVGQNV